MNKFIVSLAKVSVFLASGFFIFCQLYLKHIQKHSNIVTQEEEKERIPVNLLEDVLYFNRIPKTGSENFVYILTALSRDNNFTHYRFGKPDPRHLTEIEQKNHVNRVLSKPSRPLSYDRHVHFIDFSIYNSSQPIWFSIMRDPVDKFLSRYYYNRGGKAILYDKMVERNESLIIGVSKDEWKKKDIVQCIFDEKDDECNLKPGSKADLAMPYFCGQQDECSVLQSKWALETAKANIERWYPVVGILEDLQMTLFVLENELPLYFKGASHTYFRQLKEPHKNRGKSRRSLPQNARQYLRKKLSYEYELYKFVKQRLKNQQKLLKLKNSSIRKLEGKSNNSIKTI